MIPRQDAYERVSGQAVYTRDIYLPGMLYAKILTSSYAHAKIVSMDSGSQYTCTRRRACGGRGVLLIIARPWSG